MKNYNKLQSDLNYEDENSITSIYSEIKTEYLKALSKIYILITILIITYIIHQILIDLYEQIELRNFLMQVATSVFFSIYLFIHFFLLSFIKFSPTLIGFLKKELDFLGFKSLRKFKLGFNNTAFGFVSIIILIFINIGLFFSVNNFVISLIIRSVIVYMILGISIPLVRGVFHDRMVIKLRNSYSIQLEIQIKLIKRREIESQMVRIYMTSNKLGHRSNQDEYDLYKLISEQKWLPRKGKIKFQAFISKSNLHLREYSTPINFKEHFLNLVSAIREWDIKKKNRAN
ncbi:MAG: hypothetical protein ACFFDH_26155, partial [Promethearchaeota archaeon]